MGELNKERNKTLKQLEKELRNNNDKELDSELQNIKKDKDDSNQGYQAIRKIQSRKPWKPLVIFDSEFSRKTSAEDQVTIITNHFTNLFSSEDKPVNVPPVKIEPDYNADEIESAARKLKNNTAASGEEVSAELIKHGCRELYKQIASLLNATSETGDYPEEIRRGILTPLARPPKKHERVNVRPIILLSVLRKMITITLIDRCWERMKNHIYLSQAAYQIGRSTTEQVFTIKILAEKAITSENYDIFLLFLDMFKVFDTVNCSKLMEILNNSLTPSELLIMYLLINDVILNVKIGDKVGADILTAIGTCQGDGLSALLFILYLAYAIKPIPKDRYFEENYQTLWSALDWNVDRDKLQVEIDPKYADDITFIQSEEAIINQVERVVPSMYVKKGST